MLLTSAFASFRQSETALRIWLLALRAFYQCVLAAVWLTAWVQLLYMNGGLAHLSYQSVNVTASRQKASVSRLKTVLCSLRGRTLSQKQTLQAQIVAFCMSSSTDRQTVTLLQNINPPLSVKDFFCVSSLTVGMPPENIFSHVEMGCLSRSLWSHIHISCASTAC